MDTNINTLEICSSVCPSLSSLFEQVKLRLDLDEQGNVDGFHQELCLIITEIYAMRPDSYIKISKNFILARIVQGVFAKLTFEHLQMIYDNFKCIDYPIYNKKLYLRTSLYNSVFEFDSHYTNLVRIDAAVRSGR